MRLAHKSARRSFLFFQNAYYVFGIMRQTHQCASDICDCASHNAYTWRSQRVTRNFFCPINRNGLPYFSYSFPHTFRLRLSYFTKPQSKTSLQNSYLKAQTHIFRHTYTHIILQASPLLVLKVVNLSDPSDSIILWVLEYILYF